MPNLSITASGLLVTDASAMLPIRADRSFTTGKHVWTVRYGKGKHVKLGVVASNVDKTVQIGSDYHGWALYLYNGQLRHGSRTNGIDFDCRYAIGTTIRLELDLTSRPRTLSFTLALDHSGTGYAKKAFELPEGEYWPAMGLQHGIRGVSQVRLTGNSIPSLPSSSSSSSKSSPSSLSLSTGTATTKIIKPRKVKNKKKASQKESPKTKEQTEDKEKDKDPVDHVRAKQLRLASVEQQLRELTAERESLLAELHMHDNNPNNYNGPNNPTPQHESAAAVAQSVVTAEVVLGDRKLDEAQMKKRDIMIMMDSDVKDSSGSGISKDSGITPIPTPTPSDPSDECGPAEVAQVLAETKETAVQLLQCPQGHALQTFQTPYQGMTYLSIL